MRLRRALLFVAGSLFLLGTALVACGGTLWAFTGMDQSRFTSMAMLTGTLRLRGDVSHVASDEQLYNGATYTNWGFGVPLLELPFHAVARRLDAFAAGFFPDRTIFFLYLASLLPVLWLSLDRLLAGRHPGSGWLRRGACSLAASCVVLTYALYPLMAYRFIVYEETLSYLVVAELFALCAYIHALRSGRLLPVCALAAAAGFGLLIRATGLVYLGVWCGLVVLGRRPRPRLAAFAVVLLPFVAFWLYSNAVKSGSPLSFGYANSLPGTVTYYSMLRFGSQCADTLGHAGEAASFLARAFFVGAPEGPPTPHLTACHFPLELQEQEHAPYATDAFFGLAVPILLLGILVRHGIMRERRVALYLPYAALLFLFLNYVHAGFAWRYAFDFWPLVVLVAVQYVASASPSVRRYAFGWPTTLAFGVLGALGFSRHVLPERPTIVTIRPGTPEELAMGERFRTARWGGDRVYASRLACTDTFPWTFGGDLGWSSSGAVETFTNVYLGVPPKTGERYELRLHTRGFDVPTLRVFVNGRYYTAYLRRGAEDTYVAAVDIDYRALTTPTVMATVEWTPGLGPVPGGMLLSIELA